MAINLLVVLVRIISKAHSNENERELHHAATTVSTRIPRTGMVTRGQSKARIKINELMRFAIRQ